MKEPGATSREGVKTLPQPSRAYLLLRTLTTPPPGEPTMQALQLREFVFNEATTRPLEDGSARRGGSQNARGSQNATAVIGDATAATTKGNARDKPGEKQNEEVKDAPGVGSFCRTE